MSIFHPTTAMATFFGAFRTDTSLTTAQVQFGGLGSSFQIFSYSVIEYDLGANPNLVEGDGNTNETPDDPTQTFMGDAILWDYNYEVTDGTNT